MHREGREDNEAKVDKPKNGDQGELHSEELDDVSEGQTIGNKAERMQQEADEYWEKDGIIKDSPITDVFAG